MLRKKMGSVTACMLAAVLLLTGCGAADNLGGGKAQAASEEDRGDGKDQAASKEDSAEDHDDGKDQAASVEGRGGGKDQAALKEDSAEDRDGGKDQVASAEDMVTPEDVVEEGMEPVYGEALKDGTYEVAVDSSSSMFQIESCELTAANGELTAVMTMGGTGYLYLYMGTGEEAAAAKDTDYIPFVEDENGKHTYTVPVEALDEGIACAAFSKRKEMWYDRTLLFRADSLPMDAYAEGVVTTVESLHLSDGEYMVDVELAGGSGRAFVESPARLVVEDGRAYAYIVWSSSNYDYMKVDDVQYDTINQEVDLQGNSAFKIPVSGFDLKIPVKADTTAMSTPHEIDYTLQFDSSSISGGQ